MKKCLFRTAIVGIAMMASTTANAASYLITTSDGINSGNGSLVTDATGLATSGSLTMSSGTWAGTEFKLFPGSGSISPSEGFGYDNMTAYGSDPLLPGGGLLFTAIGFELNIRGNGPATPYSLGVYDVPNINHSLTSNNATFTMTLDAAVPVPATLWLMGAGVVGMLGFSKRKKAAVMA